MSRNASRGGGAPRGLPKKEDRRVGRTRETLHRAMIDLVLEKGYEAVTIKDIVARANVGRSTFYAHYKSKEDLLTGEMAELRDLLMARQRAALAGAGGVRARSLGFSLAFFEHAQSYRDVYRALVSERGSAIVLSRLRALFTELVDRDMAALTPKRGTEQMPRSALVQFVVGALISILTWWSDRRARVPAAELDAMFRRLVVPAIIATLGEGDAAGYAARK